MTVEKGPENRPAGSQEAGSSAASSRAEWLRTNRGPGPGLLSAVSGMAYQCRTDPGRTLDFVSGGAAELTGVSPEELVAEGKGSLQRLIHPEDRVRARVEIWTAVARNQRYSVEYRLRPRGGEVRWVVEQGHAVRDPQGGVLALEGFLLDVTEIRRLRERLERTERVEALGQVTGVVAHDFNNFLTGILGALDLAAADLPEEAPSREHLRMARSAAERAMRLTRQLLSFSKRRYERPRSMDLAAVAREMGSFLGQLVGSQIDFRVVAPEEPVVVQADPANLEQVLMNLVLNARDAIRGGGEIRVALEAAGDVVRLEVRDTGSGIEPEAAERVFRPFYTTKEEGTGLGLATVKRIADAAGGTVEVDSAPGEGTTVRVVLPRSWKAPEPRAEADPVTSAPSGTERIVVVEDDDTVRRLVTTALRRFGYRVRALPRVKEASDLDRSLFVDADLLITDITLPHWSGIEIARALREREPGYRVLFISGYAPEALPREAGEVEDEAFLEKPFVIDDLLTAVRAALDREPGAARPA